METWFGHEFNREYEKSESHLHFLEFHLTQSQRSKFRKGLERRGILVVASHKTHSLGLPCAWWLRGGGSQMVNRGVQVPAPVA